MNKLSKLMLQAMAPFLSFTMVHQSIAVQQIVVPQEAAPQGWQAIEDATLVKSTLKNPRTVFKPEKDVTGEHRYIVRFSDQPLATYTGRITGLAATAVNQKEAASQGRATKLNAHSVESQTYLRYLEGQQDKMEGQMASRLGRGLKISHRYRAAVNAITVTMTQDEAKELAALPGIDFIERDIVDKLETDRGPTYIGAPALWDGDVGGLQAKGEGIVIGILDSGINSDHPSFAQIGGDGYEHINPLGEGVFLGECDPDSDFFNESIVCNNKLIGRYNFVSDSEETDSEDFTGHGSHVASTAAGNFISAPVLDAEGEPVGLDLDISGVAPHANIVVLKVCDDGGCSRADRLRAIDQMILDGVVDVVNHSIGSQTPVNTSPWESTNEMAFLAARAAGITVANSAGNNGPELSTMSAPSAPWQLNVGSVSHDRTIPEKTLSGFTGGEIELNALVGAGVTAGYGPAPIVYAANYSNGDDNPEQCLNSFPEDTWTNGEIVVCDRGEIARVDKCKHVRDGGAAGCILTNVDGGSASIVNDAHVIPAIHIPAASGNALKTWLGSGSDHMGIISSTIDSWGIDPAAGSIAANSTSRGPNSSQDYLPVTFAAPGVNIYAAQENGVEFGFASGTSMASPHAAGAAALLKQVQPEWTDAEILSALATTANSQALKEDGETPANGLDLGGGVIRVDLATEASLLLDEAAVNFRAADPVEGGDPTTLNVPGMLKRSCLISCSWIRTLEATVDGTWTVTSTSASVTVSPESFELLAGETQTISVVATSGDLPAGSWNHAEIVLTPAGDHPVQHLTVAFSPSFGNIPPDVEVDAMRSADSYLISGFATVATDDLHVAVAGLVRPTTTSFSLEGDSDNSSPYDDVNDGIGFTLISVPEGATLLNAFTESATSDPDDVDLFVGLDTNGNGRPDDSEQVCASGDSAATEFCQVINPEAGSWWVMVQNWNPSEETPDSVLLSTTLVTDNTGNVSADAPTSAVELAPFDIRLLWDLEGSLGDTYYGTMTLGTDAATPGDIGTIPIVITLDESDVVFGVDSETAKVGDTLTFTGSIAPNLTRETRDYILEAKIPEGFTLVDGSVTGDATIEGSTLTWNVSQMSQAGGEPSYTYTTSLEDSACAVPFANSGAYADLEANGIFPATTITGDGLAFSAFPNQNFNFYGETFTGGFNFTDDGIVSFTRELGATPWINTALPDASTPNNLIAGLWRDMVIPEPSVEPGSVVGVTLGGAGPNLTLIEYDNVKRHPGDGEDSIDFQIAIRGAVDDTPGEYEIFVAFDNIVDDDGSGTIGVENATGTAGTQVAFNDVEISNGMAICFNSVEPTFDPTLISFQVTVNESTAGEDVITTLTHSVSSPGSVELSESVTVNVDSELPPVEYEGTFRSPFPEGRDIAIGRKPPITLLLTEMGERTIEPTVIIEVVAPDGTVVRSRPLGKNRQRVSYVTRIRTANLEPGEYTILALIDNEPVAERSMTLVRRRR